MSATFSQTLNALQTDSPRHRLAGLAVGVLVLGLWLGWFFLAELPVYEVTPGAHLEVSSAAHPVEAPVGGRVVTQVRMVLGQEVAAGEVLVELDAEPERLRLEEELRAEGVVEVEGSQASRAERQEAQARARAAEDSAKLAEEEASRVRRLFENGVVAEMEAQRANSEALQRRAIAEALKRAASRDDFAARAQRGIRRVRVERVRREMATLEEELETNRALADGLAYELERLRIRAPVAGKLGEISTLRVGSVVRPGERVASVVPPGELRIVADYAPAAALGRIRSGQPARARLDGFPWTQYGSVPATVARVASEPRQGFIRVELAVQPDPASPIPYQHGLTGTVEVEVERASPASLVLRTVGHAVDRLARGPR
uniref:Membrane fusion component of tripartite multidrug resistance system n=1 Tax=Vitiosangium cumulatum TaxID=1867796 RepID=A0A7D5BDU3_9BACT|nr:membrane fusion component of tripartite multidrug resistance system [Vitiosangium cumulatum]